MTLLTMTQQALREVGEFEVPATIVGNNNPTAVQMLALAQREGRELSRRHQWQRLLVEKTEPMVASQEAYSLPSDFRYALNMVWFDRTTRRSMPGPLRADQWQYLKAQNIGAAADRYWRIRGDQILIYPTPDTTDTFAYEYVSTHFCESSGGAGQASWAADTDVGRLDEEIMTAGLVWRFLESKGLPYQQAQAGYERTLAREMARDGVAPTINFGTRPARGRDYVATDVDVTWNGTAVIWGQ